MRPRDPRHLPWKLVEGEGLGAEGLGAALAEGSEPHRDLGAVYRDGFGVRSLFCGGSEHFELDHRNSHF